MIVIWIEDRVSSKIGFSQKIGKQPLTRFTSHSWPISKDYEVCELKRAISICRSFSLIATENIFLNANMESVESISISPIGCLPSDFQVDMVTRLLVSLRTNGRKFPCFPSHLQINGKGEGRFRTVSNVTGSVVLALSEYIGNPEYGFVLKTSCTWQISASLTIKFMHAAK